LISPFDTIKINTFKSKRGAWPGFIRKKVILYTIVIESRKVLFILRMQANPLLADSKCPHSILYSAIVVKVKALLPSSCDG